MPNLRVIFPIVALCCAATNTQAADTPEWKELARHTLGGAGGWDLLAVDPVSRHVYITRAERLMVADVDSGKPVGEVPGLKRAHGVALVPALHRGYVSSGGDDRVVAFDLQSLKPVADIPTGKNPDAMLFDDASGHVFVFNGRSNDATVIDAATNKVVATIALPGKPELAAGDAHGKVFVNLEDKNQLAVIDAKTNAVTNTWSLGSCEEPSGLAIDARHARLFSVCSNKQMAVLDAHDGKVIASVAIGDGPDGAAFDPASANAFSSNSDGTLTIVHEDDANRFRVLATVSTPARARTITLDGKTHRVVLPFAQFGAVPEATSQESHPRPPMKADTFGFVVVGTR
jgi:YVTN family beta-propeller protein